MKDGDPRPKDSIKIKGRWEKPKLGEEQETKEMF